MSGVDLHLHTTASDGSLTPRQMVEKAVDLGYQAIAITDHDTVGGLESAVSAASTTSLELIPGIEINTDAGDHELHILGYFIDFHQQQLLDKIEDLQVMRYRRAEEMVSKINKLGYELLWEEVKEIAGQGTIGRAHVARAIINRGYAENWDQAFSNFVGKKAPAYVPRKRIDIGQAVQLIKAAGGIAVLAHPGLVGSEELVVKAIRSGVEGIEVYYYEHSREEKMKYKQLAAAHGLIMTGGSDDHGPGNKDGLRLGKIRLSYHVVKELKDRLRGRIDNRKNIQLSNKEE